MRVALLFAACLAAAATAAAGARASTPALDAKRAEAQAVLQRVNALGMRFGRVVDSWDGARIDLARTKKRLAANRRALGQARRQSRIARTRLAQLLVALYEHGTPTLPEIVVGASSLSDLVDELEAARTVNAYNRRVAAAAQRWERRLTAARAELERTERARRSTVAHLARERRRIGSMLAQRRRMLASVQGEVKVLQAREAVRQHALLLAARVRLAREAAARLAAARLAAEQAAAAPPPPASPPAATTAATTTAAATTAATGTTTTAPAPTPAPAPAPTLPAGYPQAAAIALRYLGVPYRWGGASPSTGFDCSGLVMYVYAQLGVQLPHQAAAQYAYGVAVPRNELQPGDLVFYDGLSHVAIYIGNGQVVHAPQTGDVVRIAPLAQAGGTYVGARRL